MAVRILTKGYEYFVKLYKCFQILVNVPRPLEYLSNGMNMLYHFQNNYRPWKYLQKEWIFHRASKIILDSGSIYIVNGKI